MAEAQIIEIPTAKKFLEALRRSNDEWLGSEWRSPWIFRGQRVATRDLTPSAWRERTGIGVDLWRNVERNLSDDKLDEIISKGEMYGAGSFSRDRIRQVVLQRRFEFAAMLLFVGMADELGFRIPGPPLPEFIPDESLKDFVPDTPAGAFPHHTALALAQHHKMPTRLLDWTLNPLVAAFFAAERADPSEPGQIAVWAYNLTALSRGRSQIRVFTVPRFDVGFLHAQEGLFTYLTGADWHFLEHGKWPQFEARVFANSLRKLTLPNRETPELRRLLWAEGVSKAHLMPTLDNVAEALHNTWKTAALIPRLEPA
jgi:hypothetical protein